MAKEPFLKAAIIEILVPFPPNDVIHHITQILNKGTNINLRFALLFVSTAIVCLEEEAKIPFKGTD